MKTRKIVLGILLVLGFVLLGANVNEVKAGNKSVNRAYKKYLNSHKYDYEKSSAYGYYDIDKNGTKELIITYESGVRIGYDIFTCKKGKVIKLASFAGTSGASYDKTNKCIVLAFSGGISGSSYEGYILKGKKLVKKYSYEIEVKDDNYASVEFKYYKNSKEITEKKFNKFKSSLKYVIKTDKELY